MLSMVPASGAVFAATIVATFMVTFLARKHAAGIDGQSLASQRLNRWLIGLSAGATANSGFIVTAAVGLGYQYGAQWLLLPLAWLVGDTLFWAVFPGRINAFGQRVGARTLTDLIAGTEEGKTARLIAMLVGLIVVICLTGYTASQWMAGQKFVNGAFGFSPAVSLALFAGVIIAYTAIGGFRGSIYADSMMAVIRIFGTAIALWAVVHVARKDWLAFRASLDAAGPGFLDIFAMGKPLVIAGFIGGYATASFGFGLGQPQIVSRYLAGRNQEETQAAWWIYIGFVQLTWIAMTVFGIVLRGVMPGISDPEAGLSVFFASNFGAILTGIIVADIFSTIAATSNSLLVAMAQSLKFDVIERAFPALKSVPLAFFTLALGGLSMVASLLLHGSVMDVAVTSVAVMGAGLAPAVLVRVLAWRNTRLSLLAAIIAGVTAAVVWKASGASSVLNEAAPGILIGLAVNFACSRLALETELPVHSTGGKGDAATD